MSHLTANGQNVPTSPEKPLNSLVPPQEEKMSAETGDKPFVQRSAEFIREQAARMPLDLSSDADPARDKAVADSVRGGFVDDVGVEENRRIFNVDKKEV